jgi:2-polyprenyl-3-methyl-5-hydroxy-6-metoxy-1,4-benzoquinol methylase
VGVEPVDPQELVAVGYDRVSRLYRADDDAPETHLRWVAELLPRLSPRSWVVDLGCGCGVPVSRDLAAAGHRVLGVDVSQVQIQRARALVPAGDFRCQNMIDLRLAEASLDTLVCLYALIHLPLDVQPGLIDRIGRWLRPGGWLLATAGQDAWTGSEQDWLGSGATMWWSHAAASTYRTWIEDAGLEVVEQAVIPEGTSAHSLFWARRPD